MINIKVISSKEQKTSEWSGGNTTELFIYPENGCYQTRDFKYRISTAVCKDAHSVFTHLPDVKRELLVLEGDVTLTHNGEKKIHLREGDIDIFSGGDVTESDGMCIDFNLMVTGNHKGKLSYLKLPSAMSESLNVEEGITGIYLYQGRLELEYGKGRKNIMEKDFVMINADETEKVKLLSCNNCKIAIVKMEHI